MSHDVNRDDVSFETFFSETYSQARSKFLAAAQNSGLPCTSHFMPDKGVAEETLAIDVVQLGATDPRRVIMVFSGAHGVEGFAGSAIQVGLMATGWARGLPDDMAVVLVHGLNPHGMSWSRRECEDGSDLTRNLSHHLYPPFANEDYELFHPLLVPADVSRQTLAELAQEYERVLVEQGIDNPTPILRIGQYTHPDGLTYHGREASWSTKRWIEITRQHARNADAVMFIDIHTGYGDYGDLLVQNPSYRHSSPAYGLLCEWLGEEPAGYSDDGSIIEHRIETFEALHRQCRDGADVAAMYFEFGTRESGAFIDPWIRNNWHYHRGDRRGPDAVQARRDFADFFYVRKADWKASVWRKGVERLTLLRDRLAGIHSEGEL